MKELGAGVVRALAADLGAPTDVSLTLTIGTDGKITKLSAAKVGPDQQSKPVVDIRQTKGSLTGMRVKEPALRGKSWTLSYTRADLAAATAQTHATEMLPIPAQTNLPSPPTTHMFEMAPRPLPNQ
jgi:hypothetical protein